MVKKYKDETFKSYLLPYIKETRQYLSTYGVYSLSDEEIWNAITKEYHGISRVQYAYESCFDSIPDGATDKDIVPMFRKKFESGHFSNALKSDVMALCDFLLNYLDDNKIAEIQFVYKNESSEADAIYKNLLDCSIPITEQECLASLLIELDPRSSLHYEYIFCNLPQAKYEISAIAQYLSVDLSALIEKDLNQSFDLNIITCEEDALAMMTSLKTEMEKFCVSTSSRKNELEAILHEYDVKARTYDGILFATKEIRAQAETDDQTLFALCGSIGDLDKQACKCLIDEIANAAYITEMKDKYSRKLEEKIAKIDNDYLSSLLIDIDRQNEADCNHIKSVIDSYDATGEIKRPYVDSINERIYSIWDQEDFEHFKDMYIQTSPSDLSQIEKNISYINETGRTQTKQLFIDALANFNEANVQNAAKYAIAKEKGTFSTLLSFGKGDIYKKLTLDGSILHPDIATAMEQLKTGKDSKKRGFFSGFGSKKNSAPQDSRSTAAHKFCSSCGTQLSVNAKFCSECGENQD